MLLAACKQKYNSLFLGLSPVLDSSCTTKLVNCTLKSNSCGIWRSRQPVIYSVQCHASCEKLVINFVMENDIKMFFFFYLGNFWMNPQYWLHVLPVEDSKKSPSTCNVVISLMQKHSTKHRNRAPHLFIGFLLYKVQRIALIFLLSPNMKMSSPCRL